MARLLDRFKKEILPKLAEKLGMRREGEFIDSEFFKGDWCSMWLYAILTEEFKYAQ